MTKHPPQPTWETIRYDLGVVFTLLAIVAVWMLVAAAWDRLQTWWYHERKSPPPPSPVCDPGPGTRGGVGDV